MLAIVVRGVVLAHGRIAFTGDWTALGRALSAAPADGLLRRFFGDPADFIRPPAPSELPGAHL
jgi:hypothetical protein